MEEKLYCYGATYAICLTIVPFCVSDGKKTLKRSAAASYKIDEGTKQKQVKISNAQSSKLSSFQVNRARYRTVSECLRNNGDVRRIETVSFEQAKDTKNFAVPRRRKQILPKNEEDEPFESCFTEDSGIEGIHHAVTRSLRSPVRVVLRTPPKTTGLSTLRMDEPVQLDLSKLDGRTLANMIRDEPGQVFFSLFNERIEDFLCL